MRQQTDKQTRQYKQPHYLTYVVLLDEEALKHAKLCNANPEHVRGMPCVYVGSTCKSKEERFANHKRGHKSSWWVRTYGLMLVPEDVVPTTTCTTRKAVSAAEQRLMSELRSRGWAVWSN